jgi:uncharacterized protein (DUF302 family)
MHTTRLGIGIDLDLPYEEALTRTTEALRTEGFGILTSIDVQATMRQKLNKDFRKYTILGACNPPLAYRALEADLEIGTLLPCNVIVYEVEPGRSAVIAMSPGSAMSMAAATPELEAVAHEAETRLHRVLGSLEHPA